MSIAREFSNRIKKDSKYPSSDNFDLEMRWKKSIKHEKWEDFNEFGLRDLHLLKWNFKLVKHFAETGRLDPLLEKLKAEKPEGKEALFERTSFDSVLFDLWNTPKVDEFQYVVKLFRIYQVDIKPYLVDMLHAVASSPTERGEDKLSTFNYLIEVCREEKVEFLSVLEKEKRCKGIYDVEVVSKDTVLQGCIESHSSARAQNFEIIKQIVGLYREHNLPLKPALENREHGQQCYDIFYRALTSHDLRLFAFIVNVYEQEHIDLASHFATFLPQLIAFGSIELMDWVLKYDFDNFQPVLALMENPRGCILSSINVDFKMTQFLLSNYQRAKVELTNDIFSLAFVRAAMLGNIPALQFFAEACKEREISKSDLDQLCKNLFQDKRDKKMFFSKKEEVTMEALLIKLKLTDPCNGTKVDQILSSLLTDKPAKPNSP